MGKVISCFSTKGGVGKTLVSVNLAVQLIQEKKKVFLLDLDLGAPQVTSRLLGINPKYSLYNLIDHLVEFKSKKRKVENYIETYKNNLYFLPSISKISQRNALTPDVIRDFISVIWDDFDYIIIDAGSSLTDDLITTFELSNLILLVLTPDILAVYQTQWLLDTLQSLGFPLMMIKIVLNRAESKGSIAWKEVKTILPAEVIATIPSEGKTVGLAINRSIPVVLDTPLSRFSLSIKDLSKNIMNRSDIYVEHKTLEDVRLKKEHTLQAKDDFWQRVGLMDKAEKITLQEEEDRIVAFKKGVHKQLLEELDLKRVPIETYASAKKMDDLRKRAERVVTNIISKEAGGFISSVEVRDKIIKDIIEEALGLGPLEDLLRDNTVTEIMVNNKDHVYIERNGKLERTSKAFTSDEQVRIIIERILAPLGRRIDEAVPYVDARLPDGSRVNGIIHPLSLTGPTLTIRKFAKHRFGMKELIEQFESLTPDMANFLEASVLSRRNILVSGGTGSGKTTFLNIMSEFIPESERIVTIEDSAELRLKQAHWVRLEARPPNIEGKGEIPIRELFKNTLRMRPDRIVVGEVRGEEVLDMLQAMNTGHDGSMSTIHANSTYDVLIRLDSMILMSGVELPIRAVREMISSAINVIVQTARLSDGSRRVTQISEITGMSDEIHVSMQSIFVYKQTGVDKDGKVQGYFTPTGNIPTFYDEIRSRGIPLSREIFVPKD